MISHAIALVSVHVFENNNGTTFIRMVEVVRLIVTETMANIYIYMYVCMYVIYIHVWSVYMQDHVHILFLCSGNTTRCCRHLKDTCIT